MTSKSPFIQTEWTTKERPAAPIDSALDDLPDERASSNASADVVVDQRVKVFVVDTSVLLHDHNAIKSFEDNKKAEEEKLAEE